MSTLSFSGDMARLKRAFTESHDAIVRRGIVLETLNLRTGERIGAGLRRRLFHACGRPICRADGSGLRY